MSNWLFLMLLYGFFGWMKKRQRDKARDKIESQDDWDNGGIVDFGEGILEEHLSRLTERFYRVDKNRSRNQGGTGLGLSIVKHITNKHSGKMKIESQIDKGSTFSVSLPIIN